MRFLNLFSFDNMYFTISYIAFMLCLYGVSTDNTTDYIHQLELEISDLKSHSLASEQKQAAVLSSIISRLQLQEEKIQSQEQEMQELKIELQNATKTDSSTVSSSGLQSVVFEARTSQDLPATRRIYFDKISTNVGNAYFANTGAFKAPRNGTFQIWFRVNLEMSSSQDDPAVKVTGGSGATIDGIYVARKPLPDNKQHHVYKVLQDVLVVSLVKGDPVYLTLIPPTAVKSASSFGGFLLGDM